MPITIHCPHDNTELEIVPDSRTPEGLFQCPKCHCKFRICLATFDKDCYRLRGNGPKSGVLLTTPFNVGTPKRKRGRPPKKKFEQVLEQSLEKNKDTLEAIKKSGD
jgi:hypothetical protein